MAAFIQKPFRLSALSKTIWQYSLQNQSTLTQTKHSIRDDVINLTDASKKRIERVCPANTDSFVRIIVDNGGCSGFQYKFQIDTKVNEDDILCGPNGRVVVDSISLEYCTGSTLDYHEDIIRAGFKIVNNPKASNGCSCGVSFAIKLD